MRRPGSSTTDRVTDTHWNTRGAMRGFNLAVVAAGQPEWALDGATALAPHSVIAGGDLARFLDIQDCLTDTDYPLFARSLRGKPLDEARCHALAALCRHLR